MSAWISVAIVSLAPSATVWLARSAMHISTPGNSLEAALFGFAGVIIGAVITGGSGYVVARKKERADAAAEGRREDVAIRRAARLIDADLMIAETGARMCAEKKKWWSTDRRLTSEAWQQYRDVIAPKLSWSDWVAVMVAVEAVGDLQGARDGTLRIELAKMATDPETAPVVAAATRLNLDITDPRASIPEATATQIEPMLRDLLAGRAALAPLTREAPLTPK